MPRKQTRAKIANPTIEKMARRLRAAIRDPSVSARRNHPLPSMGKKHATIEQRIKHAITTPSSDEKKPIMILDRSEEAVLYFNALGASARHYA